MLSFGSPVHRHRARWSCPQGHSSQNQAHLSSHMKRHVGGTITSGPPQPLVPRSSRCPCRWEMGMESVDRYTCHTSHFNTNSHCTVCSHCTVTFITRHAWLKTRIVCSMKIVLHLARHVSCLDTRYTQHLHSVLIFLTFLFYPGTSTGGHIFVPLRRTTTSSRAWQFSRSTSSHRVSMAGRGRRPPDVAGAASVEYACIR